jgi:hypothetical protein
MLLSTIHQQHVAFIEHHTLSSESTEELRQAFTCKIVIQQFGSSPKMPPIERPDAHVGMHKVAHNCDCEERRVSTIISKAFPSSSGSNGLRDMPWNQSPQYPLQTQVAKCSAATYRETSLNMSLSHIALLQPLSFNVPVALHSPLYKELDRLTLKPRNRTSIMMCLGRSWRPNMHSKAQSSNF